MKLEEIRQGLSSFLDTVAEGWGHLRQSASSALTRFRPGEQTNLPARGDIDDVFYLPSVGWSMLGNELFEDDKRIVVRVELPGMNKEELQVDVQGDALVISGEKRFERENSEGRYRMLQCAYGSFRRVVTLPANVRSEMANASYKNGVLRIELPKMEMEQPRKSTVKVE